MNWDDLRPFLAVLRAGSLSGAARELRVEHATIARRIDRLERDLNLHLFERLARGWRPTPAALALAERAQAAELALQAVERQSGEAAPGPVRLAAPPLLAAVLMPKLAELLRGNPGLQLVLETGVDHANLAAGEADLALRLGPVEGASLRMRRIAMLSYRPYGLDASLPVIRPDPPRTTTERWMRDWSGARPVVLNTADTGVMHAAVAAGLGIALLPDFCAGDLPAVGEARLIRPLHLVLHGDKARLTQVRLLAEALADLIPAEL